MRARTRLLILTASIFLSGKLLAQSPGNVSSNLVLWLKADAGTGGVTTNGATVTTWTDQSTAANSVTNVGTPSYNTSGHNGNPSISFDGSGDYFSNTTATFGFDATSAKTMIAVSAASATNEQGSVIAIGPGGDVFNTHQDHAIHFNNSANQFVSRLPCSSCGDTRNPEVSFSGNDKTFPHIFSISSPATTTDVNQFVFEIDGGATTDVQRLSRTITNANGNWDELTIASGKTNSSNIGVQLFGGTISEVIVYGQDLSTTDRQRVNSYLALKYGIPLDQSTATDYVASDGTTEMWDKDATDASTYNNDIAGIGRDDNSELGQVQSQSINTTSRVQITAESEGSNASPSFVDIADLEFLTWGHNAAAYSSAGISDVDGTTIEKRIARTWLVQETGEVGDVTIEVDLSDVPGPIVGSDLRLLIDADGTFATGASNLTGTYVAPIFTVTGVNINDGEYFSIGSVSSTQTPLPIELSALDAKVTDESSVQIEWQTVSESNNDFFTVERSKNGKTWTSIAKIAGAGHSSATLNYTFTDQTPHTGVSYYRLKQTDFDGTFEYSSVRRVNVDRLNNRLVTVYPNPTYNQVNVSGNTHELSDVKVYNAMGKDITLLVKITNQNEAQVTIDLSDLIPGIYTIKTKTTASRVLRR